MEGRSTATLPCKTLYTLYAGLLAPPAVLLRAARQRRHRPGLWQALDDHGAEVVLAGHDHDYERFAPHDPTGAADPARGIRAFVVGTGGRSHYRFGTSQPHSAVRNADTYGVLRLTLHPTGYAWQFVPQAGRLARPCACPPLAAPGA